MEGVEVWMGLVQWALGATVHAAAYVAVWAGPPGAVVGLFMLVVLGGGWEVLAAESGAVHQGGTGPGVSGVPSTSRKVHSLTQHRQPVVPLVYSLP